MKTKRRLTLLAVLLTATMLLPLASCMPMSPFGETGRTESTPVVTTQAPLLQNVPQGDLTNTVTAQLWSVNNEIYESLQEVALNADKLSNSDGKRHVPIYRVTSKEELEAFQLESELNGCFSGEYAFYEILLGVDETLFEENDILMVSFSSGSGSNEYEFISIERQDDRLSARFMWIYDDGFGTDDMEYWLGLIAVPKGALLYLNEYDAILDYEEAPAEATEKRGKPIQHTEAMIALRAKCSKYNERWMSEFHNIFRDVYERDRIRRGDTYSILMRVMPDTSDEMVRAMVMQAGIEGDVKPVTVGTRKFCRFYATAEQLETLARNNVDPIIDITYCYPLERNE